MANLTGITNKSYISSIAFMDEPDLLEQVLEVQEEEKGIYDIMEMMGRFVVTDNPEYHHFVNRYVFKSAEIAAIDPDTDGSDGSDGNDLVVTIVSEDTMPVVSEVVMLPNQRIGWVSAVDFAAKKVTVKRLSDDAGDILSPAGNLVAVADIMIFFTQASGEGTFSPVGRKSEWLRTINNIQIFKEANSITDLQKTSAIKVKYNGDWYVMYKLQHDTYRRFRGKISYGLLHGKKAKFVDGDNKDVYMTQGLWNYCLGGDGSLYTTGGVVYPLSGATIAKTDIRSLSRQLDKRGTPREVWQWVGGDLRADIDDVLLTLEETKAGGIVYNSFGTGDGKQRALDLGVDSYRMYGRTHHLKTIDAYDHPEVFGASGYDFAGSGFIIPTGKIKVDHGAASVERLRVRYMAGDGTNLKEIETVTGKLAPTPTDDEAVLRFSYQSVMGLEALGIDMFGLIQK
ncbi:MAG: hypothetical protein DRI46_06635 [Chloroflexi bacterium]|nr:MAG: hypothetical protein DRI46_06635 [Chloroflexota bacterium]